MDSPSSFIIDQTKKFLYVTNADSNKIAVFSIDSTTGSLTEIKGSPFKTGNVPISIATIKQ
jgi:6-phosphogluconolactonase (cycloisomerase 2 family)